MFIRDKEIEKVRGENENLRKELKVVNDKLNKAIERNKPKKAMNNETNEGFLVLFIIK